jgi:D-alanyl-D-alanine dipeptidase
VKAFTEWAQNAAGRDATNKSFYPNLTKKELIAGGYISESSGHSRGDTVDITLVQLPLPSERKANALPGGGRCTESMQEREFDSSIDMGTSFDCFDPKSNTSNGSVSVEQRRWRNVLVAVMKSKGFRNYHREWWHFTFGSGTGPSYDFSIVSHPSEQSK